MRKVTDLDAKSLPDDGDSEHREGIIKRLLATAPDHKTKPKPGVSPKKREPAIETA